MNPFAFLNPARWLLYLAAAVAAVVAYNAWAAHQRAIGDKAGSARVQARWDAERLQQQAQALLEAEANAKETKRRLERQEENQNAQDRELAVARAAADRNAADADRVREQSARAAREWSARLADSPTAEDLQAAARAIDLLTDLFGRADRRAGLLAAYADTARAAGLKCERDYDALSPPAPP